jgi:hypothetical protein
MVAGSVRCPIVPRDHNLRGRPGRGVALLSFRVEVERGELRGIGRLRVEPTNRGNLDDCGLADQLDPAMCEPMGDDPRREALLLLRDQRRVVSGRRL